ncbi:MAG: HesA/MoeB/ThiF family protein [Thermacetogeniaceae bacterium]
MKFSESQIERYSRQLILKEIGGKGQGKILQGRVLVVGAGGLGSPCALYLAAAGVGTIGIVDGDRVELSNLQRQIIHFTADLGREKILSAEEKIVALNPDIRVATHSFRIRADNIRPLIKEYDFIIDGTDNFPAKFLINDACVMEGKPFSQAGILRWYGQAMTYVPGNACYRCVYSAPPPAGSVPSCSQAGILGAVAGILGSIQAAEALKFLTGAGELLTNRLLLVDALAMDFNIIDTVRQDHCPACGEHPVAQLEDEETTCMGNNDGPR